MPSKHFTNSIRDSAGERQHAKQHWLICTRQYINTLTLTQNNPLYPSLHPENKRSLCKKLVFHWLSQCIISWSISLLLLQLLALSFIYSCARHYIILLSCAWRICIPQQYSSTDDACVQLLRSHNSKSDIIIIKADGVQDFTITPYHTYTPTPTHSLTHTQTHTALTQRERERGEINQMKHYFETNNVHVHYWAVNV